MQIFTLLNKVLENVSEKTEVQLPEAFLVKWLLFSNPNITSEEQVKRNLEAEKIYHQKSNHRRKIIPRL